METTKRYQFLAHQSHFARRNQDQSDNQDLDDICLDFPTEDLAFRFKISAGYASKILTTITQFFLASELKSLIYWPHQSKHCHTNVLTSQVILIKLKGLGTVLSNGFKDHQILKLSIKLTALKKVRRLSRSLRFVSKVVLLVIHQVHIQVQQQIYL